MRPWSIAIAIVVALAIVFLIGSGSDDRSFAARARSEVNARPWQQGTGAIAVVGPEQTILFVQDSGLLPEDANAALDEVRDLLANAASQSVEQQQDTLEQALDRLDDAIKSTEDAAEDTDNLAIKVRTEQMLVSLRAVKARLELRLELLEAVS